jgi:hypothetical protein
MSTIGKFLQAKEPLFDHALHQLEEVSHRQNVDVKLAAEITERAADRMKRLGVQHDASGPELFEALVNKVHEHDDHIARAIGGTDPADLRQMIPLIVRAAEMRHYPRTVGS